MEKRIINYLYRKSIESPATFKDTQFYLDKLTDYYLNDGRSYYAHELITLESCGYTPSNLIRGFDGVNANNAQWVEVKTSNLSAYTGKDWTKLDGGGKFSNMRLERLEKYESSNLQMVVGNFVNGKLQYVLEFPYNYTPFKQHLRNQMEAKFPDGDVVGMSYTPSFRYTHYRDCPDLKLTYVSNNFGDAKTKYVVKGLYDLVYELKENKNKND